jgi:hypothetical protein
MTNRYDDNGDDTERAITTFVHANNLHLPASPLEPECDVAALEASVVVAVGHTNQILQAREPGLQKNWILLEWEPQPRTQILQ